MAGRPKFPDAKRTESGRLSRAAEGAHPESIAARERELAADGIILAFNKREAGRELIKRTADDRLAGFTLGRLLLRWRQDHSNPGGISEQQFEAGEEFTRIVHRHARVMGYKLSVNSPSFAMVAGGLSTWEPSPEEIAHVRKQFRLCYDAIMEACALHGIAARNIVYSVCIEQCPLASLSETDYGTLRNTLNLIERALR